MCAYSIHGSRIAYFSCGTASLSASSSSSAASVVPLAEVESSPEKQSQPTAVTSTRQTQSSSTLSAPASSAAPGMACYAFRPFLRSTHSISFSISLFRAVFIVRTVQDEFYFLNREFWWILFSERILPFTELHWNVLPLIMLEFITFR